MAWRPFFIVLWATSVCAFLLQSNDQDFPQVPLGHPLPNPPFAQETNVVAADPALPTIDLGYTKHKAIDNPNPLLYKFQNIRYAAPPIGDLRFRAPQPPLNILAGEIEDGHDCECCKEENDDGTCAERCNENEKKSPWGPSKRLLGGLIPSFNLTDPKLYSEDCLFLDVWTPKHVLKQGQKVPVFVWIYGGAYVFGGKSLYYPGGLMDRAMVKDRGGMVFVAMNYRMGALGFAAGKDVDDEDINAGLLDQQQALQWVHDHIEKFGGDPNQVTVAGLSAGGGSILHHLTAYGRTSGALFQRAISFFGGWQPVANKETAESTFREFMQRYNQVSTLDKLRQVPEEQMMQTNFDQIYSAPPGSFLYNPTAWGNFTPKSPSKLLRDGKFAQNVDVILSHAFDEGGQFTAAFKDHSTTVEDFVHLAFPDLSQEEKDWILDTYHSGEDDPADIGRIIGDVTFRCHVTYVSDAKQQEVWRQRWNTIRSNGHGGDLSYLFYQPLVPVQSILSARILQDYVVTFAIHGEPTTYLNTPAIFPQPSPYHLHSLDGKEQFFDSGHLKIPHVWRGDAESEEVCRVWQEMSST